MTDEGLTRDAFLGGQLHLWQPHHGYRAGIDPVLLAASVDAMPGQAVLDLGCGAGAAALCLGARVPGLDLAGVEVQPAYADLARRNFDDNAIPATVFTVDITALPADLRQRQFDHVIANPPFFAADQSTAAVDAGRAVGRAGGVSLIAWTTAAARRLRPRGAIWMIQRIERLPETLQALEAAAFGSIEVLPIAPRLGRPARLFLVRGIKTGRAAFRLHAALILHEGQRHERDGDSYAAEISAILRDAAPLRWPS